MQECLRREKLATFIVKEDFDTDKTKDDISRLNLIQLLNAITGTKSCSYKEWLFVQATLNGQALRAMVDTKATNNFVLQKVIRKLGLIVSKSSRREDSIFWPTTGLMYIISDVASW